MCLFYSLIETAKAHGLNPYAYLKYVYETAQLLEDLTEIAPWNCDPHKINSIVLNAQ